ncbi:hypothetical protein CTEN210_09021 [Chaetoceros tenuissimus]|uniref:Uncharacterized protein n=1 Tax=Chaetoceros tenuissimus TaxID=426638 RepID=A0AAD3CX12_9STRA|nr:hypothetical protein CTEN210_09021 [Chaetoceros tenuissimus]
MRLQRKLTKKEWAEIGEKYKDGGVHMYRGKRTLFYNGEKLRDTNNWKKIVYNDEEHDSWEVIIVLPGVEIIPDSALCQCKNVKTVIMADTVRRIEHQGFCFCRRLEFVRLSRNLKYIGSCTFKGCESLTSIFIPLSCREIGNEAFCGCSKLIILSVPQHTELGENVIGATALIRASTFEINEYGRYDTSLNENVNEWIKNRHVNFPLHKLCCSDDPTFNQTTIIPTKEDCLRKDEFGLIPLIYMIYNIDANYENIKQFIEIGGEESLLIEDKIGWNALHHACNSENEAVLIALVKACREDLIDTALRSNSLDENDKKRFRAIASLKEIKSALVAHESLLIYDLLVQLDKNEASGNLFGDDEKELIPFDIGKFNISEDELGDSSTIDTYNDACRSLKEAIDHYIETSDIVEKLRSINCNEELIKTLACKLSTLITKREEQDDQLMEIFQQLEANIDGIFKNRNEHFQQQVFTSRSWYIDNIHSLKTLEEEYYLCFKAIQLLVLMYLTSIEDKQKVVEELEKCKIEIRQHETRIQMERKAQQIVEARAWFLGVSEEEIINHLMRSN